MMSILKRVAYSLLTVLIVGQPAFAARDSSVKSIEDELKLKAGDETGNEVKALKTELLVMRSEKKALEQLEKLKVRYKNTRMEPEILFRLGEIYMRRARTERFFEVHRDSNQVVRFAPEMVKQASEVVQVKKAVKIYLDIESRFPRFRARDVVVFNTAYAYQQTGEDKKAEEQFRKLLAQHPNSPLVPDSLLSLGEIQYQRRQFAGALELFLKIKNHPQARVYPYGLYKAAWAKYNLQDELGGMRLLEEVIEFGHERAKDGLNTAKLDLRKEALNDLALFYSEGRKPSDAVEYFAVQARDLDPVPYVLRLVDIYERHSKYAEVDIVLRQILAKTPQSEQIALVHEKLIWNADRQKRRDVAVGGLTELDAACEQFDKKSAVRASCESKVVEVSKKLGAKLHAYWKKDKLPETADYALRTYEIYLSNTILIGHEAAQVRFAYADLMFARGRYREASTNYAMVSSNPLPEAKKTPFDLMKTDPKLAVDAAYGAVLSLEKAVGDGKWSDADEESFGKLAQAYLKWAPQGPFALDLRFKKAFIAYEKEKYDASAGELKAIGWATYPTDALASNAKVLKAQDLYLDILNIRKDYRGLKESAQALLSRGVPAGSTAKVREEQLGKIRREAWFAEVGEIEQKGEPLKAVEMYKTFAVENKASELAPRAWWNASQILFKTGDASGGASMCSDMSRMFPGAGNIKECLTQAAHTFEAIARLDLAAKVVLNLAEVEPEKRAHWRSVASDFFALSGTRYGKEQALEMYMAQFALPADGKKSENKLVILEKALQVAKELRDEKQMSSIRGRIESLGLEPTASRFLVEEAEAAYKAGDSTKAFALSRRVVGRESALRGSKDIPARARFLQARILDDEYRGQSVKARVERIGMVLAMKTEKLEKAQKAYQSAAKMGDNAVAIESFAKLGDLYIDYAQTVKAMKLPADVPAADQQAFAKEIESIAMPMEEKGIEALSQAIDASRKSSRLDGFAGILQEKLDRLNMKTEMSTKVEVEPLPRLVPAFNWKLIGMQNWNSISGFDQSVGGDL